MIRREIVLPADRDEVWDALTDPERLADWFATEVELDLRVGGEATFRWGNGEERRATVIGVEPGEHLATLSEAGLVESERAGRETRYRLTPSGAEWDGRLDALRQHLERRR